MRRASLHMRWILQFDRQAFWQAAMIALFCLMPMSATAQATASNESRSGSVPPATLTFENREIFVFRTALEGYSWRRRSPRSPRTRAAAAPPRRADGCRAMAATASAARDGVADEQPDVAAPRSARARPVEVAVAPPPRTVAAVTGRSHRSRIAAHAPGHVGVVGRTTGRPVRTRVLATPAGPPSATGVGTRRRPPA